ncbi:MAG: cell envelope integrity protein CreD [Prevotella sp.]|jgi:inner membrane protein|nr:cell envelope integrity protein CreD [Prevotella sp.]
MKAKFGVNTDMIMVKVIVVAVLVIIMLFPIRMVISLIEEREDSQKAVQNEISQKIGGVQRITGPVLVLPYLTEANKIGYSYCLPDDFKVNGDINTEARKRTLYKSLVYQSNLNIKGSFSLPCLDKLNIKQEQIQWDDAFILLGIPYLQGIKNKIVFNLNGKDFDVQPGVNDNTIIGSGLTVNITIDPSVSKFEFGFDLVLNGSEGLYITPVGKESKIHLKSPWETVSFSGDFLPGEKTIGKDGFDAKWEIFDYNRNYVQTWIGNNDLLKQSSLGVEFKYPVDQYQMTMRSVKYAIVFIMLTFVVFFLVELLSRKRIHPVQYLLVSCALVLFYTLLLAISEHLDFKLSYFISASATVALITAYSKTMFKNIKQACMMGGFLSILYTYLYIILQLESMSLLFGAAGLFIALAIVMFALRNVDWYKKKTTSETDIEKAAEDKVDNYMP